MAKKPEKVAVIGLDCALPHLIEKHIAEGHLPTFKKLFESGMVARNCLTNYPTVTPPNWATIATGALAGTHGVTDFTVHNLGTDPTNFNTVAAFSSERVRAEYIWDALDRAGKKCILLNYPGSWPSKMKHGIVVGGAGLTPSEYRDGEPGLDHKISLSGNLLVSTDIYPYAFHGKFNPAEGWSNVPDFGEEPLEMILQLPFSRTIDDPAETTWYILARDTNGQGYDRITLSPTKNFNDAFFTIGVGDVSDNVITAIQMKDGSEKEVTFRGFLVELSDDAEDFRLYLTSLLATSGWTDPPEIARELAVAEDGAMVHTGGFGGFNVSHYDEDVYARLSELHDRWLANAAVKLLSNHDWDLFYMHSHPPDWVYHAIITHMDPDLQPDEEKRKKAWDLHLKIYQSQDAMLASILETLPKNTLVVLVSDHGAVPDGPIFDPFKPLIENGLCVLHEQQFDLSDQPTMGHFDETLKVAIQIPDLSQSKAVPQRSLYVYINLQGRDPNGIVDPADYEKVQQEIIDALLTYVDPRTGLRPVALALSKQDARILGLYGDGIGDVVYAVNPWYGAQHGQQLPNADWGVGSLRGLFAMQGPGIPKGLKLERTVWLTDLVPTICYIMDWPVPEQSEGAIVYQALKDPNFKMKEINKLEDGISRMQTALARQDREPWDKHDCA